jgi:hypothetical protein
LTWGQMISLFLKAKIPKKGWRFEVKKYVQNLKTVPEDVFTTILYHWNKGNNMDVWKYLIVTVWRDHYLGSCVHDYLFQKLV